MSQRPPGDDPEFDDFDPELFERFKRYQEFQRFQKWEQESGEAPQRKGRPPHPTGRRPLWLLLVDNWLVRKIVGVLIWLLALALVGYALLTYLFPEKDTTIGPDGRQTIGGPNESNRVLPQSPKEAVIAVYSRTAVNQGRSVCVLFSAPAAQAFATNLGAPNCEQAVSSTAGKVTNPATYANPKFPEESVTLAGDQADIRSCSMTINGGPRLGVFHLREQAGGWLIVGHDNQPADCVSG